ncbi:MAG TPA: hypothetical protein VL120_13070 [Solirubrobacteraceae bacterium]|jgi:hypothetical protein|nr:hypothetical protein [Solirubrobacteraceae bacterium]
MTRRRATTLLALVLAGACAAATATASYKGRACTPPSGHRIADCRTGVHGTPDLSRAAWRALRGGAEITFSEQIDGLAGNPAAAGAPQWPLVDSLGQPLGRLVSAGPRRFTILGSDGVSYRVTSVRVRGRGCAASTAQQQRFTLVQVIARAPSGGTQAFLDTRALDRSSPAGRRALARFAAQRGTGCGPRGPERGRVLPLRNPAVGAGAHARLSDGAVNSVTEYDAKPAFANVVYFNTNTTQVSVGGIARGMVRVGTLVAKVDSFATCDPNSDGTLTWRYLSIHTGNPARSRIYGWVPANCTAARR